MERQFLRIFFLLFFLVGCQQVEINKLETTAKEKNLDSFENYRAGEQSPLMVV